MKFHVRKKLGHRETKNFYELDDLMRYISKHVRRGGSVRISKHTGNSWKLVFEA